MFEAKKKPSWKKWFSPLRLGLLMISLVFTWSIFLFFSTQMTAPNRIKESDRLKNQIIKLSKEYINTLAKEKGKSEKGKVAWFCCFKKSGMIHQFDTGR